MLQWIYNIDNIFSVRFHFIRWKYTSTNSASKRVLCTITEFVLECGFKNHCSSVNLYSLIRERKTFTYTTYHHWEFTTLHRPKITSHMCITILLHKPKKDNLKNQISIKKITIHLKKTTFPSRHNPYKNRIMSPIVVWRLPQDEPGV